MVIDGDDNSCLSDEADDEEDDLVDEVVVLEHDYNNYHSGDLDIVEKSLNGYVSGEDAAVGAAVEDNNAKMLMAELSEKKYFNNFKFFSN